MTEQATARCAIVGLLAAVLGSRAWLDTPPDRARVLSEMADTAGGDSAKCQTSGAALGSQAYKKCRALLEDKMSIEKDVPPDRSYVRTGEGQPKNQVVYHCCVGGYSAVRDLIRVTQ